MDWQPYLAFIATTTILILVPGPNVLLIVANSLNHGVRAGLLTVGGTQSAQALQLAVVALGMTSLIAAVAAGFEWLRWAGAAYLVWLGVQRWRAAAPSADPAMLAAGPGTRFFRQGFLVAATNPKVLFFLAAFLPQFVDPSRAAGPQLAILAATFLAIAAVLDGGYAVAAGRCRRWFAERRRRRLLDRLSGSVLIGAGLWLAFARRG